ncbi:PadR family transcriptional regulator [Streptomyces sp. NPDC000341]|uniref:PadR family transcriptional regulator n=1 Tax=Streptomyces sp. NPDC000341 TaxID=3156645 RepID=UPI00331F7D45
MGTPQRITRAMEDTARYVITRHLQDHAAEFYGLEVAKDLGYGPATIYPVLRRMVDATWLLVRDEKSEEPRMTGRPPRTYFRVNPETLPALCQRLAEVDARRRRRADPALRWNPLGGFGQSNGEAR